MTQYESAPRLRTLPGPARMQLGAAAVWLMAGLALGLVMAASGDHSLRSVHTHIQLLGWVSLALTGLVYAVLPEAGRSPLARWHVALHNLGLPVMSAALAAYLSGFAAAEPAIALGAVVSTVGLLAFAVAVWQAL